MASLSEREGRNALIFIFILIAGLVLRFMAFPSTFWYDEVASALFTNEPLSHLWSDWMQRETNPPLFYTLLKGWTALFGRSDLSFRLLPLSCEIVSIGLAFVIGRKVAGTTVGLVAAALLAVSPAQIHYSLEVRGYAQGQMAALAAFYGWLRFCDARDRRARRAWLLVYVLACVAACYSHTMIALLPALAGAWGLFWLARVRRASREQLAEWIAAHGLILLLGSWWFLMTVWHIRHSPNFSWIPQPGIMDAVKYGLKIYGPDRTDALHPILGNLIVAAAIAPMLMFSFWMTRSCLKASAMMLFVCALGSPLILFLASPVTPLLIPRTLFWSSGAMLICFAIGYAVMPAGRTREILLAILLGGNLVSALSLAVSEPEEPIAGISRMVDETFPGITVVADSKTLAFGLERYCPEAGCSFALAARRGDETFAADMPMPQVSDGEMAQLACRGELLTVVRVPKPGAHAWLRKVAVPVDLTSHVTSGELYEVTRWLPAKGSREAGSCEGLGPGS